MAPDVARASEYPFESPCQRFDRSYTVFIGEVVGTTPPGSPWDIWQPIYERMLADQCSGVEAGSNELASCDERVWGLAFQETWRQVFEHVPPPPLTALQATVRIYDGVQTRDSLPQRVHLKIIESAKGTERPEAAFIDWVYRKGSSKFRVGEKYVIYLSSKAPNRQIELDRSFLYDSPDTSADSAFIRARQESNGQGVVSGLVAIDAGVMEVRPPGLPESGMGLLKGATIHVRSANFSATTTTGPGGFYVIGKVPPGEYSVYAEYAEAGVRSPTKTINVSASGCSEARFLMGIDETYPGKTSVSGPGPAIELNNPGRIEGRIVGPDGSPHPGPFVELVPVGETPEPVDRRSVVERDGTFVFHGLVEGRYLMGLGLRTVPTATDRHTRYIYPYFSSYYPGVPERSLAAPIELKAGETVRPLEWLGPAPSETRKFEGVVRWDSGEPAGWIRADLVDTEFDEVVDRMTSRPDGTFRLFGVAGREYHLRFTSLPASGMPGVSKDITVPAISGGQLTVTLSPE